MGDLGGTWGDLEGYPWGSLGRPWRTPGGGAWGVLGEPESDKMSSKRTQKGLCFLCFPEMAQKKYQLYDGFLNISNKMHQLYDAFLKVTFTVCRTVEQIFEIFHFYEGKVTIFY